MVAKRAGGDVVEAAGDAHLVDPRIIGGNDELVAGLIVAADRGPRNSWKLVIGSWTRNSKLETRNSNCPVEPARPQSPAHRLVSINPPPAVGVVGAGLAKVGGGVLHEVLQIIHG